ncbi:PQQ-dependent sugar dehydrogenase [Salimicrobium flavidum]|uniref:Glucose/arabinose dehydrogenase, beta-propeller fold n=1 Tax=Salimicrobium flavidum TaxID=570947 RepID=A0A1N7IN53_9BACI|nr:PQQ-dependent sugar dehydrogenase [Salimicrobium flavidum]SIS38527.1 Glucose/arabinose dehydrogenase, beta-propeller fold [Salimicrobium flavidum]
MKRISLALLLFTASCTATDQEPSPATQDTDNDSSQPSQENGIIATNFNTPWSIAPAEDGYFITERGGQLFSVTEDGDISEQTLELSSSLYTGGEAGLLGLVMLDEEEAYVYYSYESNNGPRNRVAKIERSEQTWSETDVIIDEIPGGRIHNGGRLEIGPDEHVYITTGDAGNPDTAQNTDSLAGKILRMNIDGSIPEDNPFEESYVYTYGHRNPQGVTWTEDGTMYSTEHGQNAHDEINRIEPGQNYGWPVIQGDEENEGMETPLYHTGDDTWAPSGVDAYEGHLYIAALRGERLIEFSPETSETSVISNEYGRIRDIHFTEEFGLGITSNRDGRGNPDENDDVFFRFTP